MHNSQQRNVELGYRKGVLLGLTVAEIILLLLFALLLALWGKISTLNNEVVRAKVINDKFYQLLNSADILSNAELVKKIEDSINLEIDFSQKLAKEVDRYKNNLLPDDVFEAIKTQNFNLKNLEDRQKFFDLIKVASMLEKDSAESISQFTQQCAAGKKIMDRISADNAENGVNRMISDLEHYKKEASSCKGLTTLPPCYTLDGQEKFIFEARLNDNGIVLKNALPDRLMTDFLRDFPNPPDLGITLSLTEFRAQTLQFIKYSREKQCRFRVNAFDDTGLDKKYFQKIERDLDSVFLKRKNW